MQKHRNIRPKATDNFRNKQDTLTMADSPIQHTTDRGSDFAIIAVRCNSDTSTGKRRLHAGQIYQFVDGYTFEDGISVSTERVELNHLYDDYVCRNMDSMSHPHVQISAIVGQNGSGKSSIVEFMMRLINNLAAFTLGEFKFAPQIERLHYIDGIKGDLWYTIGGHIYQLHVDNSYVNVLDLGAFNEQKEPINLISIDPEEFKDKGESKAKVRFLNDKQIRDVYTRFFYTFVSNYSLYAYNTLDFSSECNTDEKERQIQGSSDDQSFSIEKRCWLHGLFHKNDGYQTPIVISPYRKEGNINIKNENDLAKERLLTLLIKHKSFRKINEHLNVICFELSDKIKEYSIHDVRQLGMSHLNDDGYKNLSRDIIKEWSTVVIGVVDGDVDLNSVSKPYAEVARNYLVYKTLKVAATYKQHNKNFEALSCVEDDYNPEIIYDMVQLQAQDLSHITRKIFQTLAFLLYDVYEFSSNGKSHQFEFEDIESRWEKRVWHAEQKDANLYKNPIKAALVANARIAPPFMDIEFVIRDNVDQNAKITLSSLSSGERQQIYAISSILYHLDNLNSVRYDYSAEDRIAYQNILIILEEVELYFHPELQQQFIKYLLDGIEQIPLVNLNAVHIIIVTHSPYVLSDIPQNNVLALGKNGLPTSTPLLTFCGNIHEMLKNSFFLSNGSQGYFAQWEVGYLLACLDIHKKYNNQNDWQDFIAQLLSTRDERDPNYVLALKYKGNDNNDQQYTFDYSRFKQDYSESKLHNRIQIIDEPLLRKILVQKLMDAVSNPNPSSEKARLQAQLKEIQYRLNQLESK